VSEFVDDVYFNRIEDVVHNAIEEAGPVYQPLIEEISKAIQSSNDLQGARSAVEKVGPPMAFAQEFSDLMFNVLETCEAFGRSIIVRRDEAMNPRPIVSKLVSDDWFVCDDGVVKVDFNIIPKDALEILRQKSLRLAGVESDELKKAVKEAIVQAIEKGQTKAEFEATIDQLFDRCGVTRLSSQRIDLVYRMNAFSAYSIGQAKQAASMSDRFPKAFYSAIHDSRSRHIPLEGYYDAEKVPLPPIDYNCRCTVIYKHVSQLTGDEKPFFEEPPRPDLIVFDQRKSF
jgi:hypothetical protein